MTVRALGEKVPRIHPSAWVSEAAYVVGDVEIGAGSSVWPGAVIRADFAPIRIGDSTHIEDNCVVHGGATVGDNVTVGHAVVIHCRQVGSNCLLGNNSTLLDDAVVGDVCIVAAGAVLLGRTVVPDGSFVSGVPATIVPARPDQQARLRAPRNPDAGYSALLRVYRDAGL